jgi:hypothetical protein
MDICTSPRHCGQSHIRRARGGSGRNGVQRNRLSGQPSYPCRYMGEISASTQSSHHSSEIVDPHQRSGSRVDRTDITRDALALKHTNA